MEYLKSLFNVPASQLRAVVAPYYDRWLDGELDTLARDEYA